MPGKVTAAEVVGGLAGVIVYSLVVTHTPVLHTVIVFVVCQVIVRAVLVSRRGS